MHLGQLCLLLQAELYLMTILAGQEYTYGGKRRLTTSGARGRRAVQRCARGEEIIWSGTSLPLVPRPKLYGLGNEAIVNNDGAV